MNTEESRSISVNIEAADNSRVYQVAQGNMFIGRDPVEVTARKLATLPVSKAAEMLVEMSPEERASVIAAMETGPAAARMALLESSAAVDVLVSIDELLAVERLLAMDAVSARRLALAAPQAWCTGLLSRLTLEQTLRLIGELGEGGNFTFQPDVLECFATRLPTDVMTTLLSSGGMPPETAARVLRAVADREFVTWLLIGNPSARLALLDHMPLEFLTTAVVALWEPPEELRLLCTAQGVGLPQVADVLSALRPQRLVELVTGSDIGFGIYEAFSPDTRAGLLRYTDDRRLADLLQRYQEGPLVERVSGMLLADELSGRAHHVHRHLAAALVVSTIDADRLLESLPRHQAAAVWDSRWAHGVARTLETYDVEAGYRELKQLPEMRKAEVVWHLSAERRALLRERADNLSDNQLLRDGGRPLS
ncbi:hypothetical protein [Streptomyces sp. W1SF4]|uniref:magnesium transporter MgtE N-terminal domain-containing protein n=1 Tax=Streptomyces sp. W1SF4 TaxID=2305220 RepID=UPI000F6B8A64|nr:hypothetical protein [Streptomyces sp. W1SF4]AZM92471.1 hypothetical protein D1J60_31745 [Streptomyces sp. W1SF4]